MPPAVALLNYISSGILRRIFFQTQIFGGFSLHIINFGLKISEAATDRGHYIFRMPRILFKVRRSSVGCSIAQKDAAYSSESCSLAQIGCGVAQLNAALLIRVQHSSIGCCVAQ